MHNYVITVYNYMSVVLIIQVVVNYDATIKDAKAEISKVFSSIWPSTLDSPCR